jgi:hypothetical protein
LLLLTFSRLPPLYFSDIQVWPSEEAPILRLFALLLVCLVLPVRALTLTPVAGELRHPWGLAFLPDGGYLVSGSKTWITNVVNGHCLALMVKTDPSANPRYKGMSMLITPKIDPETRQPLAGLRAARRRCQRRIYRALICHYLRLT